MILLETLQTFSDGFVFQNLSLRLLALVYRIQVSSGIRRLARLCLAGCHIPHCCCWWIKQEVDKLTGLLFIIIVIDYDKNSLIYIRDPITLYFVYFKVVAWSGPLATDHDLSAPKADMRPQKRTPKSF
jgi:hypothetical protein